MSNTEYVARGSVLCDECAETPSAQRIPCDPGSPSCFKKLDAFRASSSPSAPSSSLRTMARRSAVPTSAGVSVPTESGQRVTFNWIPGQGSAGDASVSSDCDFQSWQLEIHVQSQSDDWGVPEGCADLTESSSTSCIDARRARRVCLPAAASSDWMAFPSFRTSYAGSCLVPATAPQLLRAARSTPSMLEICFTAGAAGDCVFSGFELQMQMEGSSWMDLPHGEKSRPVTCGSLAVREGPCCSVMNLLEDSDPQGTGYFFRARETCSNGAPLASPFVTSEVALYTTSVPEVPPPSYRDPLGVITTLEAPNRLMLFFEADLQLGASDVPSHGTRCPGAEVSEADCASRCAERQDLSAALLSDGSSDALLMSARVLLVDLGSAVEPLTSCTYEVTVEERSDWREESEAGLATGVVLGREVLKTGHLMRQEGFLVTQLEPRKASPRVVWNFTHVPPAPTGSLSLHSSTETSLVVHVTYDLPVTVQCGVLTGEGVAHLAPAEDFTGARSFVEIRITGLEPFTQYTVTCTGVVIGNPALNSTVTQAGLSTLVDTDDTLSGITLVVEALCDGDGAFVQPIDAAFFPPFSPENRQYQLSLDAEEMRTTWCSEDSVEAVVRIQLQGTSTSIFARVTNPQAQVLRQELRDATTGQLPEDVSPNAVVQVSIVVDPAQLGATAPAPYVVEVVLGVLDVRVESHSFPALVEDDTTDTESGDSASLVLSVPVGLTASELNFLLGPHQQQATLSSSEAAPQQEGETVPRILLTFDFASLVGMGDGLPLIIQIQPAAGSSTRVVNIYTQISVSFAAPTVITVETTQVNNLVSLTEITFVTITGANLALADEPLQLNAEIFIASIPPTCDDSECRAAELQRLVSDGLGENLCQSTVVLSTTSLSCNVAPSASASLGLCLVLRGGLFSNYYCAATFPEALQPQQVTVTGVNTPEQEASSPEPIIVTVGSDIPPESVTQGFLQVWVSPFDEPAEDFADPGPGYFPLCADAVVLEDRRSIECYRNQDLNISELGTDLNVYVQTGQYQTSSNVLEGAIQLLLPEIIRVTRNHEYEVGELIVTIDGRHFGTAENGNMVVSVQSFGASSPVVEDPRLAEGFGDPSYTVQCETISHTDTQIVSRCTSTQTNSILGAQVEASLYTETAQLEVDESQGRRLQTTLDELALQLSQLPVAFSVGYQLECSVALRLNQSCDEPVAQTREWQSVRLRPCPAGEHRISYAGVGCLQCLPGYYKSGVGPALFCDPCELGFYMGLTGAGACTPCPPHETTQNTSSREIAACDCAENYFRRNSSVDWTLASNHGVCEPCPYGAICEGGSVLPYSAPGFWTPDRLVFWSCFPDFACLQGNADDPNLCQEGRVPHGRRCGRCAAQTYVHLSECRLCGLADRVLAWVGPFLVPLLTVLIFLPLLIRLLRSNDMARTKRSKTLIKQRGKTRNSMLGHLGDDHGEFRMLVVMWTTLQTLWICHEMPLNFTRFTRDWLWALGVTAWDFSILRPQCAYEISFVWKWLLQWLGFFVMIAFTLLCIWIYTCIHRNANRDYYYISPSQGLLGMLSINFMILLLVHLRDDLIFLQCIDCEDGKLCLAEQPAIECRLGDWEWSTMLVISLMDIFIVIVGCAYMIVLGVYKSWRWQHGNLPGLCSNAEIPWYVLFADLWVRGYIGYIKEIREAVPEFQQEYPHLESEEKRKEVWNKAIDLILAQEAEKAEILLHRLVQHLYRHHPRFRVIGEDEGPALQLVKAITSSYTSERSVKAQNEVLGRAEDGVDSSLKVADVHHVELMMNNLLDYARWTLPGCRAVKRVFAYSWAVVLLFQRFAIVIFCMLMPQDQDFAIPLTYLLVKLVSLLAEASLHPYVWTFLNDWEVSLHALIFVFMLFVSSKWSELTCDILVVVVTGCAVVPLILRLIELLICKDAIEDPTDISISIDEAKSVPSYHLEQLDPEDLERAGAPGALDHVRRGVELVNKSSASVPSLSSPPPTSVEMLQSQSEPSVAAQATIPTEHGAGDVPEEVVPDPPEECIPPSVDKEAGSAYLDPKAAGTMTPGRSIVSF
ncbi:unnamed protein product [Durusdinium trenchii]|uniref:Tyrosine-protein kinase ephrin type A/B receptor-like domain-containing protein n=2 Tax=Durusdinium trenchii TaxID=1381693 RepID=A0ABP0Q7C4_9DINO